LVSLVKQKRMFPQVDVFGVHVFQPYPGCDVWEHPEKYNITIDKDTDFDMYHTIGKPDEILTKDKDVMDRFNYIKDIVGDRNADRKALEV
jgi:hypothetical protein